MNWTLGAAGDRAGLSSAWRSWSSACCARQDTTLLCTMLTLGAFLIAGLLVLDPAGTGSASTASLWLIRSARFNQLLILSGAALCSILALDWNRSQGIARFEFPVLMLFSTIGMMIMASARNLMSLYLGLELQSLALYVLAAFARDDVRSSEAGLEVFRPQLSGVGAAAVWHVADLRLLRHDGFGRAAHAAVAAGQRVGRSGRRHCLRDGRAGLQGLGCAVPHVDAGRL